jgi:hypothetical protein
MSDGDDGVKHEGLLKLDGLSDAVIDLTLHTDCPGLEEYFSYDFHNELGKAAFEAFQGGEIVEHAVFADRIQAENLIDQLQAEMQTDDSSSSGLVASMKAKAKRGVTYLKIQQERFLLQGLETDIGRSLIEANVEEDVRCEGTAVFLDNIAFAKSEIRSGVYVSIVETERLDQFRPDLLIPDDEEILLWQTTELGIPPNADLAGSPTVFILVTNKQVVFIAEDLDGKRHCTRQQLTYCSDVECRSTDDGGCLICFISDSGSDEVAIPSDANQDRIAIVTKRLSDIARANAAEGKVCANQKHPQFATVSAEDEDCDSSSDQTKFGAPEIVVVDTKLTEGFRKGLAEMRKSPKIRRRQYSDIAIDPEWLVLEVHSFFTSQSWSAANIDIMRDGDTYVVLNSKYVVTITADDMTLTTEVINAAEIGIVNMAGAGVFGALTFGVGFLAMGGMGAAKLVQKKRLAAIVDFIDQRVVMKLQSPSEEEISDKKKSTKRLEENIPEKIKAIAKLHDSGLLTDEEFAEKKSDLLARM